jgi:hypothetical protein
MARNILVIAALHLVEAKGVCPPRDEPAAHWTRWNELGIHRRPFVIRISWNPQTGSLFVGPQCRHVLQIPADRRYPLESYLRGFWFPIPPVIALRPFFWPDGKIREWTEQHADLNDRVSSIFLDLLRPDVPTRTRIFRNVDNQFLRQTFPNHVHW